MSESDQASAPKRHWVSNPNIWGAPTWVLVGGIFMPPTARMIVWTIALTWKGVACLANARRCGRTHCYFTGPFFILMALLVLAHGTEVVPLGPHGWLILGAVIVIGTAGLWWSSERVLGKYVVFLSEK